MKKILISLIVMTLMIQCISALSYCPEPIELKEGWNGISLYPLSSHASQTGDRNISLGIGYNLIGYSSNKPIALQDTYFVNSSGTIYTYNEANNLGIINLTNVNDSLTTTQLLPVTYLYPTMAYWVKSSQKGNLTLPGVGGSYSNQTFNWTQLRFSNGSDELNISEAGNTSNRWINQIYYWSKLDNDFRFIQNTYNPILHHKTSISPWEGVFIRINEDNVKLLLENTTCPYTLTFKYKSNSYTIEETDTLHMDMKGNEFIVSSDKKMTIVNLLSHLARWIGRFR